MSADKLNPWYLTGGAPSFQKVSKPSEAQAQRCKLMLNELVSKAKEKRMKEKEKAIQAETDSATREETKEETKKPAVESVGNKRRSPTVSETPASTAVAVVSEAAAAEAAEAEADRPYMGMSSSQPAAKKTKHDITEDATLLLQAVREEKSRTSGFNTKLLDSL